jgi:hypothetical protein
MQFILDGGSKFHELYFTLAEKILMKMLYTRLQELLIA